jgi:hypothetical protein
MTDLLEDYGYGYCTDGHSDVDDRPRHSVVCWQELCVWPRVYSERTVIFGSAGSQAGKLPVCSTRVYRLVRVTMWQSSVRNNKVRYA